jgi:hypothetical protein
VNAPSPGPSDTPSAVPSDLPGRVFRLPPATYLVVLFLAVGAVPLAFTNSVFHTSGTGGEQGPPPVYGWQLIFLLVPIVATVFIARTATFVDAAGITVRAAFGRTHLSWDEVRGLSVTGRSIYAVLSDGAVRLPCVRQADLGPVSRASGGRLPELPDQRAKPPLERRRKR